MSSDCQHHQLRFDSSNHVEHTKYKRIEEGKRVAATLPSGRVPNDITSLIVSPSTFPAPLVLPEDELAHDGKYPPQSLRSWTREGMRNAITPRRNTIYVVGPPTLAGNMQYMRNWSRPNIPMHAPPLGSESRGSSNKNSMPRVHHPATEDIIEYFEAFFHGVQVKTMPTPWRFVAWDHSASKKPQTPHDQGAIGLETSDISVRIRTRESLDGFFERQLNLSDLLDVCLDSIPHDAYAVILLVEQDMYEDEDDDFCCGRAYGGSRVAVASTARYHPHADEMQGVERDHAWPASHCAAYMEALYEDEHPLPKSAKQKRGKAAASKTLSDGISTALSSPMQAAVEAHSALPSLVDSTSISSLDGLWLGRVCRTAAHEIGHCLGMDHCVYYACLMQSTASIGEDARQPPYLCPVDLAKLTAATRADVAERYEALLGFCEKRVDIHLYAAYGAWLKARLNEMKSGEDEAMD